MVPEERKVVDVLCVGMATWDIILKVGAHPPLDAKVFADDCRECGGGPAANAAVTVAKLGGGAAFAGYLGDDLYGDKHMAEMQEAGVDTSCILRGRNSTRLSVILVKPSGERSVVCWQGNTPPRPPVVGLGNIQPKVLLFDGHEPELSPALAAEARKLGIPVVLDAGSVHKGTLALLKHTDYLVCSREFAREYCEGAPRAEWLKILGPLAPALVITLGDQGLVWKKGDAEGQLGTFPVEALDTTGAGDIFHGAFAFALASQWDWNESLRFATAAAAFCCQRVGARWGCPSFTDVEALLTGKAFFRGDRP